MHSQGPARRSYVGVIVGERGLVESATGVAHTRAKEEENRSCLQRRNYCTKGRPVFVDSARPDEP